MRLLKISEDLMIELKPEFQYNLFSELIEKYGRLKLSEKLKKSSSLLYAYKNNRVKSIPETIIAKSANLLNLAQQIVIDNTIRTFSAKESIKEIMQSGIEKHNQLLRERLSIPFGAFNLLQKERDIQTLNVLEWIEKNKWIEKIAAQKGLCRDAKIENTFKDKIEISYFVYNRQTKKCEFYSIFLPKLIKLDIDICYFLGLLYGDGLAGARVGIVNQDKNLISWTSNFLKNKFKGKIVSQLSLYKNYSKLGIDESEKWLKSISDTTTTYKNLAAKGTYVYTICIVNKILRRIIDDFLVHLNELFQKISFEQKGAFLAGFFDAEGNVNKLDRNLRFSQKIKTKVKAIQNVLLDEGYHQRYDGSNILIGHKREYKNDLKLFEKQIFPFLKHSDKTTQVKELLEGYFVREDYKPILKIILENPGMTHKEISRKINRVKCSAKLNALKSAGFVKRHRNRVDESFKYLITDDGLRYLGEK